jgi:rhamnosyltransferase
MLKKCSIIIRTKNEEKWINACLSAVYKQSYKNFEIIIIDNESTDRTIDHVKQFPIDKILNISKYFPGKALNLGINNSRSDYIVCLSGHCIPVNNDWLKFLVEAIEEDSNYACAYGRQEPMSFSSSADKRDLLLTFGLDKRIQIKDSFFHNANSIIRREVLDQIQFDNEVTNIEDRLWAEKVIQKGYNIVYEPLSSVYHYHGIHQDGDKTRCANIVNIVENLLGSKPDRGKISADKIRINSIIPSKGDPVLMGGSYQIEKTIDAAIKSKYIDNVFVVTDNIKTQRISENMGAKCPFIRPVELSEDYVGLDAVYKFSIDSLENSGVLSDLIVALEPTFPFRYDGLIDEIIEYTLSGGYDSVVAATLENGSIWKEEGSDDNIVYERLDSGDAPRKYKESFYIGIKGLCCVTHPIFLRNERILGDKVGLFRISERLCSIEVRNNKLINSNKLVGDIYSFLSNNYKT